MKIFRYINFALAGLCAMSLANSCNNEDSDSEADAVMSGTESLIFEAKDAPAQTLSVFADGTWNVEVSDSWIHAEPLSGSGSGEITVTVDDNYDGGSMNGPREGRILISGRSLERQGLTVVSQKGDSYLGVSEYTITELTAMDADARAKVKESQVAALSANGYVLTDGESNIFVIGSPSGLQVGDLITLNGTTTLLNGMIAFTADEVSKASSSDFTYPTASVLNASYSSETVSYVSFAASMVGENLRIDGKDIAASYDTPSSLGLGDLDLHKVEGHGYYVGEDNSQKQIVITDVAEKGVDESLIPYPLRFAIGSDLNYTTASFAAEGKIDPIQGLGYLQYVPYDLENTNGNNKYKLDVSGSNPRCTGPWPGDYWLFHGSGAIKAGSKVRIKFETRTSATGHKFWRLEYKDGDNWKVAGEAKTTTETGDEITYTHTMNSDGKTNVQVDNTVTFNKNNSYCEFRFLCVANWQANGNGPLVARNGGTARLACTDPSSDEWKPSITIVEEGDGTEIPDRDPVYAVVTVDPDLLVFEGKPEGAKTLKITSDHDFEVTPLADWISLDVTSGSANAETEIAVTCTDNDSPQLREGAIKIVSEDTKVTVRVIQSAAGSDLKPLISIVGGNTLSVSHSAGQADVTVQANVEVAMKSDVSWITVAKQPASRSSVEEIGFTINYEENTSTEERTGHVSFYNSSEGLESVLTVIQSGKPTSKVYFEDDFNWLKEWADAEGAGDAVGEQNSGAKAPNTYTMDTHEAFQSAFTAHGYEDLNPSARVMYLQKYYLKFSKGKNVGGIRLPAVDYGSDAPANVTLSFDWCAHMGGSGKVDATVLVVELEGGGTFKDTGTATSNEIASTQESGQMFWQNISLDIVGATNSTRITIKPKQFGATSGYYRYHLDNFKIIQTE